MKQYYTSITQTPTLCFSKRELKRDIRNLKKCFDFADIYYAMKANTAKDILEMVNTNRMGVEVASQGEFVKALQAGIPANMIISSNTVKSSEFIKFSAKKGLNYFSIDSYAELKKFQALHPKANLYIRLIVDNSNSDYPLGNKFGVDLQEATTLLQAAKALKLNLVGCNFHVGSQCRKLDSWQNALSKTRDLFSYAQTLGFSFDFLNLGGGLPVHYVTNDVPSVKSLAYSIETYLKEYFPDYRHMKIALEPGRAVVAESATLVTTVIGKGTRYKQEWIVLDTGIFNGLIEFMQGFKYPISTSSKKRRKVKYTIYGPSCDSMDRIIENIVLPEVDIGDKLYFHHAGAYTTAYASEFNGFKTPSVVFV